MKKLFNDYMVTLLNGCIAKLFTIYKELAFFVAQQFDHVTMQQLFISTAS
jgi:hypothetical protein